MCLYFSFGEFLVYGWDARRTKFWNSLVSQPGLSSIPVQSQDGIYRKFGRMSQKILIISKTQNLLQPQKLLLKFLSLEIRRAHSYGTQLILIIWEAELTKPPSLLTSQSFPSASLVQWHGGAYIPSRVCNSKASATLNHWKTMLTSKCGCSTELICRYQDWILWVLEMVRRIIPSRFPVYRLW